MSEKEKFGSKIARTLSISKTKSKSKVERSASKDFAETADKLESQLKFRTPPLPSDVPPPLPYESSPGSSQASITPPTSSTPPLDRSGNTITNNSNPSPRFERQTPSSEMRNLNESESEEEVPLDFFSQMIAAAKKIVLETKNLKDLGTGGATEEELLEGAKNTALSTFALLDLVQSHFADSSDLTENQNLLIESTKRVRTAVLTFIDAVKAVATNPFDFFSKQQLSLTSKEVVESIKQLISSSEHVDQPSENNGMESSNIVEDVRKTTQAIKDLQVAIEEGDPEKFALASKAFVLNMNQLVTIVIEHNIPIESQMKDATLALIHTGKIALNNNDEPVISDQWKRAQKNVSKCLQTFLFYTTKSNKMKLIVKTEKMSAEDQSIYKCAEEIISTLKENFPRFNVDWDDQTQESKTEKMDLIASKLKGLLTYTKEKQEPREDNDMKELKSLMTMKTTNDWHKGGKRTTLTRKDATPALINVGSDIKSIALGLKEPIVKILTLASEMLERPYEINARQKYEEMNSISEGVYETLKKCLSATKVHITQLGKNEKFNNLVLRVIESGLIKISSFTKSEKGENPPLPGELNWEGNLLKLKALERQLPNKILIASKSLRTYTNQILSTLNYFSNIDNPTSLLYQIEAECISLCNTFSEILTCCRAYYFVLKEKELSKTSISIKAQIVMDSSDKSVWEEPKGKYEGEKEFVGGTLNQIMRHLTSVVETNFMTTFITTYQSFTTPWMVVEKLSERYRGPPDGSLSPQELLKIKLRVCVVLNYWISKQFRDFDDEVIDKLSKFLQMIKHDSQKEMQEMGNRLSGEFTKQIEKRSNNKKIQKIDSAEITELNSLSPSALFMQFNDQEVAKQLTTIEFRIFSKIKPSELLRQAWNKPELQYRSPHVTRLIARANKMSFFVASTVLWHPKVQDRIRAIEKFIRIAEHLHNMNNFNTLVSLIAGLNVSAISRLKFTWEQVDSSSKTKLEEFQQLFSPAGSFKNYRNAKKGASSKGAVLPYIGVPLSDLTFAEDGNPDILPNTNLINFSKRELLSKIIVEFQLNQTQSYNFNVVEPLYSFFQDLPTNDEKELYDLSLQLEPRGAQKSEIK